MCSLVVCNENCCVSKANGPIALKIGVDVGTGLVFSYIRYETNRGPGSRDMGIGSRWSRFAGKRTKWLNYAKKQAWRRATKTLVPPNPLDRLL